MSTTTDKTAEQLAAEKAAADLFAAKKEKAGEHHFVKGDRVYQIVAPVVLIPDLGERTALDLMADEEAQDMLIELGSGAIEEIG